MPDESKKAEPAAGAKENTGDRKAVPDCIILDNEKDGDQSTEPKEIADALEIVSDSVKEMAQKITETYYELFPSMNETMQEAIKAAIQAMNLSYNLEIIQASLKSLMRDTEKLDKIFESDEWKHLTEIFPGLTVSDFLDALETVVDDQDGISTTDGVIIFFGELKSLLPFIPDVLNAYKKKSGLQTVTFRQFLDGKDPATGEPATSLLEQCVQLMQGAPNINSKNKNITSLIYPIDKVNNTVWQQLPANTRYKDGFFHINAKKYGSKNDVDILYNIDFTEKEKQLNAKLEAAGKGAVPALTVRTKRVMIAANELYRYGDIFSRTQLYHAMGYKGRPGANDLEAIEKELDLLLSPIKIDNRQEVEAGYKYSRFKYDGALMPHERVAAWIDGILVIDAIHLFRQPPLMEFAEGRDNITTIPITLLDAPKSKTIGNLTIDDYLISRIAKMKNPKYKSPHKILYETVYKNCGINSRMQKRRAQETISEYLNHYTKQKYIKGFSVSKKKDGVNIRI